MKDARHRLTSKILEKSAERPKCLEAWLSLAEPSSCKIRWRYRTYHAPWCSYIQPFDNGDLLSRRLHLRVKPQPVRPSAINMILGQWTFFKLTEAYGRAFLNFHSTASS